MAGTIMRVLAGTPVWNAQQPEAAPREMEIRPCCKYPTFARLTGTAPSSAE
jgi:hypothetical protein